MSETKSKKNYGRTKIACYFGFITQAITANFTPLLFLTFRSEYGIPLGKIALISGVFYFTQLLIDLFCAKFVDRIGYRVSIIASELFSALGLVGLAFLPDLLPSPFAGIIISVTVYAVGSGLIEVLCSPIVEACPFEHKEATMSLLHSFYCWGTVGTILIATLFFAVFGIERWKIITCLLAVIPAVNIYNFATCPIEHLVDDGEGLSIKELFSKPLFWAALVLMICSGASELSMSQWASAFAEDALGLSKTVGDLAGPCLFAAAMGITRVFFGKYGDRINLNIFMTASAALAVICYILASAFSNAVIGLAGCILCGFAVAIMWPGTISISSKTFPAGGTAMFALLAMAGDLGGSLGPTIVGEAAERAGGSIRIGLAAGLVFPVVLLIVAPVFRKAEKKR